MFVLLEFKVVLVEFLFAKGQTGVPVFSSQFQVELQSVLGQDRVADQWYLDGEAKSFVNFKVMLKVLVNLPHLSCKSGSRQGSRLLIRRYSDF